MTVKLLPPPKKMTNDDLKKEVMRRMAILFQVPLELITKNYEKDNRN